tara:strand:+ start:83 stop:469 length:387 start_codon:yes stop_codon:yes gene_type:complete
MVGLNKEFKEYFDKIRDLDWTGLDLWVYGGIVSHWETKDIDAIIIGDTIPHGFLKSIEDLGPWEIYYTNQVEKPWFPGDNPIKLRVLSARDNWLYYKLPTATQKNRLKAGFRYGDPVKLIDQGVIQFK